MGLLRGPTVSLQLHLPEGFDDDIMKIGMDHSICKESLYLKHHSLLAELSNMGGGPH